MCRHPAAEMEDIPSVDDEIRITRIGMDYVLRTHGGFGVTAELSFDPYDEMTIGRDELQRILDAQGCDTLSDAQWSQLMSVYPAEEEEEHYDLSGVARQLTFGEADMAREEERAYTAARRILNPEDD